MATEIIDLEEVLERVQEDYELLLELLDIYQQDFAEKSVLLEKAINEKNYEEVRNIAHSLKGASGNISAKKLHQAFLILEQKAKENNLDDIADLRKDIAQSYELLKKDARYLKEQQGKS